MGLKLDGASVDQRVYVPKDSYKLRCCHTEFGESKRGNKMITLTYEIESPTSYTTSEGKEVQVAGVLVKDYLTLTVGGLKKITQTHKAMGLPEELAGVRLDGEEVVIDEESGEKLDIDQYIGQNVWAIVSSEEEPVKNEITKEPILHPETGEPLKKSSRKIDQIL